MTLSTFLTSLGLLKRKEWARKTFIGIMGFGILYLFGSGVLQHLVIEEMVTFGAMGQAERNVLVVIQISTFLMFIAFGSLFAWIIKRLTSPEIRAEFTRASLSGVSVLVLCAVFGMACSDNVDPTPL